MEDKRNLFAAIGLSLLVLVGWQFLVAPRFMTKHPAPEAVQQDAKPAAEKQATTPLPSTPGTPAATPATAGQEMAREAAIKASPRVPIRNAHLAGSISLKGGRIDDLTLTSYRETPDPGSANIVLFSPSHTADAFYAQFGLLPGGAGSPEVPNDDTVWTASGGTLTPSTPVTLTWTNPQGVAFKRQIAVDDNYMFTVTDSVTNNGAAPLSVFPYAAVVRQGTPNVAGYYVLFEGLLGYVGDGLQEWTYAKIDKEGVKSYAGSGGFIGITDKYWAAAVIPDQDKHYDARFVATTSGPKAYQTDIREDEITVAPGATQATTTRLFAGAKVVQLVDGYEKQFSIKNFDLIIDWGWFYFITKPLFKVIDYLYHLIGNFGLAILVVTVLLKALFFPLANKSYASMAKMKKVQPQLKELQERNKDDKAKLQQEMMALYKKEKINPVAGCWPMLIQVPVFFALYKVIFTTIEMRQAPFFGWIHDLSAPDPTNIFNLFGLVPFTPPHFFTMGLWPLIMGLTMFIQMKMNPEPPDPTQKMMFTWMPLIFTFMMASFPAGLVIYYCWNNTLTVLQQGYIMKKNGVKIELWDNLRKLFAGKKLALGRVTMATERGGPDDPIEAGRLLFARECAFRYAAGTVERLPPAGPPEIAFAGRSNAGKSSLINALTGRNALARTSRTPGRTQELIFFDLGGEVMIVDMPGYGYAAAPVATVKAWSDFARDYLRGRRNLLRVYLLVDARHGLKAADLAMLDTLDASAVSYQVVLTKADEVKPKDVPARIAGVEAALVRRPAAYPGVLLTSAQTGAGLPELRSAVVTLLAERA